MRRFASLCLLFTVATSTRAQVASSRDSIRDDQGFTFYSRGPYRPNVPRPDTLLGYRVGDLQTQFAWQERVLLAIAAAAPDRIRVEIIGRTSEHRTQRLFIVSSPENIQRLDAIRADLTRLSDPRNLSAADADALSSRLPAVVWINESVHGNESPGFEAAMQTLYQLAASEEPATVSALRNVIVVLNPSTNPDGHERFATWYNSIMVRSPEPEALEYREPWTIQGRYNHYRFDMNRDVMTTTQRESQALLAGAMKWHPMVAVDQHGYTYSFFFPPTARPMNANLGGDFQKWMEIYGKANATAFDQFGWMYYSRDVFDFYGPFYWDSWPSFTGAIGMTYETDCGWGVQTRRADGSLCTFRGAIAKHYVAALATIEITAARKTDRVKDWAKFRREAVDEGRTMTMKRVVLVPGKDPARTANLVATLLRNGLEIRRATAPFTAPRAHAFADDAVSSKRFDAGVYVIDMAQPNGRVARAVLEPAPAIDSTFARIQMERFQRNYRRGANVPREGYEFYDVTAWSLPVTFGVEAWWTEDLGAVSGALVTRADDASAFGGISGAKPARSAYVFTSERNGAPRLAYRLLAAGYRVALSERAMETGGQKFPRGSYVVRVTRNDSSVHTRLEQFAREAGVDVVGVNTAFTESEQFGIGSESMWDLKLPVIALVGDEGVSHGSYGAAWFVLEQRYGITFTPVQSRWLGTGDLSKYNVIIIPDASSATLNRLLGKEGADRVKAWVSGGGTLITMGGASTWAARENVALTSAKLVGADAKPDSGSVKTDTAAARRQAAAEDLIAVTSPSATGGQPASLPGSHFDVVLDRTHWLTSGFEDPRTTVMLDGSAFFSLSKDGANVAVFPKTGRLQRAGWVWPENTERLLRNSALLIEEPTGGGHVVLFANEPFFRAWWHALDRLVLNAIVLGPAL
jgi:hypothetical protein